MKKVVRKAKVNWFFEVLPGYSMSQVFAGMVPPVEKDVGGSKKNLWSCPPAQVNRLKGLKVSAGQIGGWFVLYSQKESGGSFRVWEPPKAKKPKTGKKPIIKKVTEG